MKYVSLISGVLLIAAAFFCWIFYVKSGDNQETGCFLVGLAGVIIAVSGLDIHEKEGRTNRKTGTKDQG